MWSEFHTILISWISCHHHYYYHYNRRHGTLPFFPFVVIVNLCVASLPLYVLITSTSVPSNCFYNVIFRFFAFFLYDFVFHIFFLYFFSFSFFTMSQFLLSFFFFIITSFVFSFFLFVSFLYNVIFLSFFYLFVSL